jgi:hypothetical protein
LNSDQRRGKSESAVFQKTSDRRQQPWKLRGRQNSFIELPVIARQEWRRGGLFHKGKPK